MPGPPDDIWDEVLEQMEEALDALGFESDATRDALTGGVLDALRSMFVPVGEGDEHPRVVVLDGGRNGDDAPTPRKRPPLRVASSGRVARDATRGHDVDAEGPEVTVRVVTHGEEGVSTGEVQGRGAPTLIEGGRILAREGWQTVFRGEHPRPYRLACNAGLLDVAVDGVVVEQLQPGQTLDVEARLVRVRPGDDAPVVGSYARLT